MTKIQNVIEYTDPARVQQDKPPFCVSWIEDGTRKYEFFSLRFMAYNLYEKLKAKETPL